MDAFEEQLAEFGAEANKLEQDIRKHLLEWISDDYETTSPLEYSKDRILELVDDPVQRLRD